MHEVSTNPERINKEIIGNAIAFDKTDKNMLKAIYEKWYELNTQIALLKGRRIMFPIELLEGIICLKYDMWKVTDSISRRYDLWDPNALDGKNRILLQFTTNALFQTVLTNRVIEEIDRILFVKLFIVKEEPLRFEVYDFDAEQFISNNIEKSLGRIIIKYSDLQHYSYNNVMIGEL